MPQNQNHIQRDPWVFIFFRFRKLFLKVFLCFLQRLAVQKYFFRCFCIFLSGGQTISDTRAPRPLKSTFARWSLLIVFIFGIWRFGANDPFYVLYFTSLQELMCIHVFLHHVFLYSCVCVFLRLETFPGKRLLPILMANPSGDERKTILCYFSL